MRAALAVRDQAALQANLAALRASLASSTDPNAQTAAIFSGLFLDTRSSIMFGAFLVMATFFFGVIRAYAPKLTLMSIFGTIAVDVYFSIGPLFPSANYTLLNSFLIALASYMAIAIVVNIFVFPETMNHACLEGSIALVGGVKALIDKQTQVLQVDLAELAPGTPLMAGIQGGRSAIIAGINGRRCSGDDQFHLWLNILCSKGRIRFHQSRIQLGQMEWRRCKRSRATTASSCHKSRRFPKLCVSRWIAAIFCRSIVLIR